MTLDLTKPLQTRDGRKVEIITTKGREPYQVLGYIAGMTGVCEWTQNGDYRLGMAPAPENLINTPVPRCAPPRGTQPLTYHWLQCGEGGKMIGCFTGDEQWIILLDKYTKSVAAALGWHYLGPVQPYREERRKGDRRLTATAADRFNRRYTVRRTD